MTPVVVGVSLKTYLGHAEAARWLDRVAALLGAHPAVRAGAVECFVAPTFLQVPAALQALAPTRVRVAAQDVSAFEPGAYTGEVSAAELAEIGVRYAEIGHAERRSLFGETDDDTASKAAAALRHGLVPVLCVGETERGLVDAAAVVAAQLERSLAGADEGRVIVAYEPVWAIGAADPAPPAHIRAVAAALREALRVTPGRGGSSVVYGGSAGPGLLDELGDAVDGLFLGRRAHDPDRLLQVVDEAAAVARRRVS